MRDRIAATLSGSGYEITHSDLYGMNWNPVLSPSDFGTRKDKSHLTYALEQRHHVEAGTLAEDIKEDPEEHTSELQSLMRISYAVFCLKTQKNNNYNNDRN